MGRTILAGLLTLGLLLAYAPDAEFDVEAFLAELDEIDRHVGPVKLVSLAHTYNLDGYTIPDAAIQRITAYCHSRDPQIYVMLDAAQSVPHIPTNVVNEGIERHDEVLDDLCDRAGLTHPVPAGAGG